MEQWQESQWISHHKSLIAQLGGFPNSSVGKESACNVGDMDLIPVVERSPGEGNSYPLQYSSQRNSMDHSPWFAIPFSSGPHSVRPLHHDPPVLGGPTRHGLVSLS